MMVAVYELLLDGVVVYIGRSQDPHQRLKAHRWQRPQGGHLRLGRVRWFPTLDEADQAERRAIMRKKPLLNIHHTPAASVLMSEVKRRSDREAVRDFARISLQLQPAEGP